MYSRRVTLSDAKSDSSIPGGDANGVSRPSVTVLRTGLAIGKPLSFGVRWKVSQPHGGLQMPKQRFSFYRLGQIGMGAVSHCA